MDRRDNAPSTAGEVDGVIVQGKISCMDQGGDAVDHAERLVQGVQMAGRIQGDTAEGAGGAEARRHVPDHRQGRVRDVDLPEGAGSGT